MAKDKRRTMSTDLNDINLNDTNALTDEERAKLQMSQTDPVTKSARRKKAM